MSEIAIEARRFLEAECPVSYARSMIEDPLGYRPEIHRKIGELGWLGIGVSEKGGGLALGAGAVAGVAAEAGRVVLPGPLLSQAALAAPILDAAGDNLLPYVLSGESICAVAIDDSLHVDGKKVTGEANVVLDANGSEHLVVIGNGTSAIVDIGAKGLTLEPVEFLDLGRRAARIRFEGTPIIVPFDLSPATVARIVDGARLGFAAEAAGVARRALEIANEYAKQRIQFDRPIGSFQAVQHLLAGMLERVELARAAVDGAANALDANDENAHAAVLVAKASTGESCVKVCAGAIQVHGGIGFTWEHDIHLYYRRAVANATLYGDPATCRKELAALVL